MWITKPNFENTSTFELNCEQMLCISDTKTFFSLQFGTSALKLSRRNEGRDSIEEIYQETCLTSLCS